MLSSLLKQSPHRAPLEGLKSHGQGGKVTTECILRWKSMNEVDWLLSVRPCFVYFVCTFWHCSSVYYVTCAGVCVCVCWVCVFSGTGVSSTSVCGLWSCNINKMKFFCLSMIVFLSHMHFSWLLNRFWQKKISSLLKKKSNNNKK